MSLTVEQVGQVARLARIRLSPDELSALGQELNGILHWIDQLQQVDTKNVENFSDLDEQSMLEREDIVCDGNCSEAVLANAPDKAHDMFSVPKVVE